MTVTLIVIAVLIAADQITKYMAVSFLQGGDAAVIDGVFRLTYTENRGAAFGILADHRWVFMVISAAAVVLIIAYIWRVNPDRASLRYGLALMAAGGAGNMIDRVARGYVVDFLEMSFVKYPVYSYGRWHFSTFPVFNVADVCVTLGCVLVIYHVIVNEIVIPRKARREKQR